MKEHQMSRAILTTISSALILASSAYSTTSPANTFFEKYEIENFTPTCTNKSSEGCATYQPPGACDTWGYVNIDKSKVPFGAKVVNKTVYDLIVDSVNAGQLPQSILNELSYGIEVKTGSPGGMTSARWKLFHHQERWSVENYGFTIYNNNPSIQSPYKRVNKKFNNWAALDIPTKILVCHNKTSQYRYIKSKLFEINMAMITNSLPNITFSLNDNIISWDIDSLTDPEDVRDIDSIIIKRKVLNSQDVAEELAKVMAAEGNFIDSTMSNNQLFEYSFELCDKNNYCEKIDSIL